MTSLDPERILYLSQKELEDIVASPGQYDDESLVALLERGSYWNACSSDGVPGMLDVDLSQVRAEILRRMSRP